MKQLINGYVQSCMLVKSRISELTRQRNSLHRQGNDDRIEELDLERRIKLLYEEHSQMQEIIEHLTAYKRRIENIATT